MFTMEIPVGVFDMSYVWLGLFAVSAIYFPALLLRLGRYMRFLRDRQGFCDEAVRQGRKLLPFSLGSTRQVFLLDPRLIKQMFLPSKSLDYRNAIEIMHEQVWTVPRDSTATRQADKIIGRVLVKSNLDDLIETYEQHLLKEIDVFGKQIGAQGTRLPMVKQAWTLLYNASVTAFFGQDFPMEAIKEPFLAFNRNKHVVYEIPLLPILPGAVWKRLLPHARTFFKGRELGNTLTAEWQENPEAVSKAWTGMQQIVEHFHKTNTPIEISAPWNFMILSGLVGATAEIPLWIMFYLSQSPKLLQAIEAEVLALPDGPLCHVDFKQQTPLLHSAVNETLRLIVVMVAGRTVTKPFELPGVSQLFQPGTVLKALSIASNMNIEVWGDHAESWNGARFVTLGDGSYSWQPCFGGGTTTCPGRFLAVAKLTLLMAHLLRNYVMSPATLHQFAKPDVLKKDPLAFGPPIEGGKGRLVDLDGTVIDIKMPKTVNGGIVPSDGPIESVDEIVIKWIPRS